MSDIANELRERSLRAEQEGEPMALLHEAADEIERLRLTDAERFVLREVRDIYADQGDVKCDEIAAVLDGLLRRRSENAQDAAAMPPASAGSHGSNGLVAYYVHGSEYDTGCEFAFVTLLREHAEASGGTVETLVQITDEEREAIRKAMVIMRIHEDDDEDVLEALLERTK